MTGVPILLGTDRSPTETLIQVNSSTALRIDAPLLRDAAEASSTLRHLLLRYAQALFVQISNSVASNAFDRMESRLARWLLMVHDRIQDPKIHLTHEFMAMMIAAQRSGVTLSLHILEGAGMIRSTRGLVTILDREKLEDLAGDAYGPAEAEYHRLMGFPIEWRSSEAQPTP